MALTILDRRGAYIEKGWSLLKAPISAAGVPLLQSQKQQSLAGLGANINMSVVQVERYNKIRMMVFGRNQNNATADLYLYGYHRTGPAHLIGLVSVVLGNYPILLSSDPDAPGFLSDAGPGNPMDGLVRASFAERNWNDVVNGNFSPDQNWTKGTGWTIAASVATKASAASAQDLTQIVPPLVGGRTYRVTYTISGSAGAGSIVAVCGTNLGASGVGNGVVTGDVVANGTAFALRATGADTTAWTGSVGNLTAVDLGLTPAQQWWAADTYTEGATDYEGALTTNPATLADDVNYLDLDLTASQYSYVFPLINLNGAIPMTQCGLIYLPIAAKIGMGSIHQSS